MGSSIACFSGSQHKCVERPVRPVFPNYLFCVTMIKHLNAQDITCAKYVQGSYANLQQKLLGKTYNIKMYRLTIY